jgi:Toprim domain-containing protein
LFGLYQARDRLARGAVPVIAEGPFDAIGVTLAGQDSYAGVAPGGTALTSAQIEALSRSADLCQAGILTASDGDTVGCKAAVRAYDLLRVTSDRLPAETAEAIRRITGNQELPTADEHMHPIANPPLPQIASKLRADAAFQITRTAERLGFTDYSDVPAEVASTVTRKPLKATGNSCNATPMLVEPNFPRPPRRPAPMPSRRQPQPAESTVTRNRSDRDAHHPRERFSGRAGGNCPRQSPSGALPVAEGVELGEVVNVLRAVLVTGPEAALPPRGQARHGVPGDQPAAEGVRRVTEGSAI